MGAGGRLKKERIYILHAYMLSCFSPVQLFVTLWTVAHQSPLSMGFSRQEYWSGLLCPPPGDLPHPEIELASLMSPALSGGFFTTSTTWEAHLYTYMLRVNLHCCRVETRRRQWQPTPVLLPGKSYGQRSLVGCSPWGH